MRRQAAKEGWWSWANAREVSKRRPKTARRRPALAGGRKRVLVVLFVPSVQRDGVTAIDQARWVDGALEMFGRASSAAQRPTRGHEGSGATMNGVVSS